MHPPPPPIILNSPQNFMYAQKFYLYSSYPYAKSEYFLVSHNFMTSELTETF